MEILWLLLSFVATVIFVHVFRLFALNAAIVDIPNDRSSHTQVTPRGGGIGIVVTFGFALFVLTWLRMIELTFANIVFIGGAILAVTGLLDDVMALPAKLRLAIQFSVALLVCYLLAPFAPLQLGLFTITWPALTFIFSTLLIVWSINLYNFMDGIDGFSATQGVFYFVGVAGLCYLADLSMLALLSLLLASSILGFLVWNFPPAKIFMGDVGSCVIGFLVVVFALMLQQLQLPLIYCLMLYGVFLFDATVTLLRRIVHGEVWYLPHKTHAYQRLHQAGWSHRQINHGLISINSAIFILTMLAYRFPSWLSVMMMAELLLLSSIYLKIENLYPMFKEQQ